MRPRFPTAVALVFALLPLLCVSAHDDKKAVAVFNSVAPRVSGGDIKALDDLKTLDPDDGTAALLFFFHANYNVMRATPQTRAFAARTAELAAELPGSETYFKGLFKKGPPAKNKNSLANQRQDAINCLVYMKQRIAIRIVAESLADPELDVDPGMLGKALADMGIKGAPYSPKERKEAASPDAIAKWKEWYEANKATFAAPPTQ